MKIKYIRLVSLCFVLFLGIQMETVWAAWVSVGGSLNVDSYRSATCTSQAIAVTSGGTPYVTWYEQNGAIAHQLYVKHFNGSDWQQDGASINVDANLIAGSPSIAFSNDTPYVTWHEWNLGITSRIYVKRFVAGNWVLLGGSLNLDTGDLAKKPSIAFNNNTPYVTWHEGGGTSTSSQIYVKHFNGSAWIQDGGSLNIDTRANAFYSRIAVANNLPYVTWIEETFLVGPPAKAYVKHFNGSSWIQDGGSLNTDANQTAVYPIIGTSNNTPYVAWGESNGTADQIIVKFLNGGNWFQAGGSLNVDPNHHAHHPGMTFFASSPYVSWFENEGAGVYKLYVKHWNGSAWVQDGSNINQGSETFLGAPFTSLAVSNNAVYAAWSESDGNAMQMYVKENVLFTPTPTPVVSVPIHLIAPHYTTSGKTITTTIAGVGFSSTPVVKLVRSGIQDIIASNVVVKSNYLLSCTFDLTAATPGLYDVMIDIGGTTGYLRKSFQILQPNTFPLNWSVSDIGLSGAPAVSGNKSGIFVGDGDNNSLQEIYTVNRNERFYRHSWQGAAWANEAFPELPSGEMNNDLIVCDGNNDGTREVYVAAQDNHVYQYSGANWDKADVGSGGGQMNALAWGDGDNDGQIEIYATCEDGYVYQFQYNAGWVGNTIAASSVQMRSVAVGDADNDNEFEVYASDINYKVHEISFTAGNWNQSEVGSGAGIMNSLVVANIDGDGTRELYGANEDYKIYQFVKVISDWQKAEIGAGNGVMFDLIASDGDNSGTDELYAVCGDGHVYQVENANGQWITNDIGDAQTPLYALAIGDGMNDNQYEIYAVGENSHVYQFKASSYMPTPTPIPNFGGKIIAKDYVYCAPNPARGNYANVVIHTQQTAEISVKMFATSNQEVLSFRLSCPDQGQYTKRLNISNLANGVYLLYVNAKSPGGDEETVIKKMAIIK